MNETQEESLQTLLLELAKKHGDLDRIYPLLAGMPDRMTLLAAVLGAMWADGWPPLKAFALISRLGITRKEFRAALQ